MDDTNKQLHKPEKEGSQHYHEYLEEIAKEQSGFDDLYDYFRSMRLHFDKNPSYKTFYLVEISSVHIGLNNYLELYYGISDNLRIAADAKKARGLVISEELKSGLEITAKVIDKIEEALEWTSMINN